MILLYPKMTTLTRPILYLLLATCLYGCGLSRDDAYVQMLEIRKSYIVGRSWTDDTWREEQTAWDDAYTHLMNGYNTGGCVEMYRSRAEIAWLKSEHKRKLWESSF